jgi:hypothetical protein
VRVPLASSKINLDPTKLYDQSSLWVARHIHCQLTRKQQGKIILEAASKLDYLDPRRLRVRLGDDYRFHDGSPITAADVIASFNFLKESRGAYQAQFALVDLVVAVDAKTLVFEFKEPSAKLFLDFFSTSHNPILPKSLLERAKDVKGLLESPTGCGRYTISEYVPDDHLTLAPLKSAKPRIVFSLQRTNQITGDRMDRFDLVYLTIEDFELHSKSILREFRVFNLFDPYQIVMGLNATLEPWKKEANRCAFFSGLDPSTAREAYKPNGSPAQDLFPRGVLGFSPQSDYPGYYVRRGGRVTLPTGRPLCVSFVSASIPQSRREGFRNMLAARFPDLVAKELIDPRNFGPAFLRQKCDALIVGFKSNNLDGADFLNVFTEEAVNYTGFWEKTLKERVTRAQKMEDPSRRADAFRVLSSEIRDKCLIYPIVTVPYKTCYVRRHLHFPDLEKSILNEYFLGDATEID